ncbi:MAG: hypothetical protein QM777_10125 [Pseudorhodoferax sp.]
MARSFNDRLHLAAAADLELRGRLLNSVTGREDLVRRAIAEGDKMGMRIDKDRARRWLDRHPETARLAELSDAARAQHFGGKPPV